MDPLALSALFVAALINAAIPGPILLLVLARAAAGGMWGGVRTASGGVVAVALLVALVWTVILGAVTLGPQIFSFMKIAGIGVLLMLGLKLLRAPACDGCTESPALATGDMFEGLAVAMLSPFNLIFFLALLPQFVSPVTLNVDRMLLVSVVLIVASALPLAAAVLIGSWQARVAPWSTLWAVRAGGAAMLGFAGLVAVTSV
jgi:threonine/homoserine/homoserine lactone efflux protein